MQGQSRTKSSLFNLPAQFWQRMAIKMAQKEAKGGTIVRGDLDACPPEENVEEDAERRQMVEEAKEKGLTCRTCDQFFASLEAQQAHFKGEWHLFNLQRMLVDQARVDETTFTALRDESLLQQAEEGEDEDDAEYGRDASSDSSSEDEDGAASNQSRTRNRPEKGPRMRVTTSDGRVISFWRAILPSRDLEDGYFSLTASQEQGRYHLFIYNVIIYIYIYIFIVICLSLCIYLFIYIYFL